MVLEEDDPSPGDASQTLGLTVELLGAYSDLALQFRYSGVTRYDLVGQDVTLGHADWRYDEFRVSDAGRLLHEIQWWGARETATWIIEAEDVTYTWRELDAS